MEHAEIALDDLLDELEALPLLEKCSTSEEEQQQCKYCEKPARYVVKAGELSEE